jgi:hypothetical protein
MNNTPEIKQFIIENESLFWYIPEKDKEQISHEVLVEFILNYGRWKSVKRLLDLLGVDYVADIFYKLTNRERQNLFPQVENFFSLYFERYAHRNIKPKPKKTA